MMKKVAVSLFAVLAFGLMAFSCEKGGMAPVVHMCKSYVDVDSCKADVGCKWNDGDDGSVARCKAR